MRVCVSVFVATVLASVLPAGPVLAAPAGNDSVVAFVVRGVGNGHGRGLSQWGAYGRAVNGGQSWQTILDAYYGGTIPGFRSEPNMRVQLTKFDGLETVGVISRAGAARWNGSTTNYTSMYAVETSQDQYSVYGAPTTLGCPGALELVVPVVNLQVGSSGTDVVRLQEFLNYFGYNSGPTDGQFGNMTKAAVEAFQTASTLTVDGLWRVEEWTAAQDAVAGADGQVNWGTPLATNVAGPIVFSTTENPSAGSPGSALGLCDPRTGAVTHYRGRIEVINTSVGNRVVNQLDVENYLRGVVPKESSASWGDAGGRAGMNALRAQAVAARSYGLAQNRYSYAKTCDTTSCQVYAGAAIRASATANGFVAVEQPNTDEAITNTAGTVRLKDNAVVSTEFSASNGPRTAGGSFPSIDDPWDDVPGNPNHRWTRIIDADDIVEKYGLANANGVVTARASSSPYDGIWANEVRLGNGSTVSAWDFRNAFGLPAPGFELIPVRRNVTSATGFGFIGDSVGESIAGAPNSELRALLDGVHAAATFDAKSNRRTQGGAVLPDGVGAAGSIPVGTNLVIVELGYNDDPASMPGRIDGLMAVLRQRNVGSVAWVNLSERRPQFAATNAALNAARSRWSELTVLDWESASDDVVADRWYSDNVHLTATGRAEFSLWLRDVVLAHAGRPVVPSVPLRVPVLGQRGVPATGVVGVALNVTAVNPTGPGYLRVWPCGSPEPTTSTVNFLTAGAVEPNGALVPVDSSGEVCIRTLVATDVVVDVAGWFAQGLESATGRLVDTREGVGRVVPGVPLRVDVLNQFGLPAAGVVGVALNVTAVNPIGPGYLRVWPCGAPEPTTSSVNFIRAGAIEPNGVVVPVDTTGQVCIASLVETDVVVDLAGWFSKGLGSATGRLVDTREGVSRVVPGAPLRVKVLNQFGVPAAGAVGVALNVTAVNPSGPGYLRVWPCGSPEPETSSVNFVSAGAIEPNGVVVPVDATGEICVGTLVSTDVVVDVAGWFDSESGLSGSAVGRIVDTRYGIGPIPGR